MAVNFDSFALPKGKNVPPSQSFLREQLHKSGAGLKSMWVIFFPLWWWMFFFRPQLQTFSSGNVTYRETWSNNHDAVTYRKEMLVSWWLKGCDRVPSRTWRYEFYLSRSRNSLEFAPKSAKNLDKTRNIAEDMNKTWNVMIYYISMLYW